MFRKYCLLKSITLCLVFSLFAPSVIPVSAETESLANENTDHLEASEMVRILEPQTEEEFGQESIHSTEVDAENGIVENLFLINDDMVVQGVTSRQDYFFELSASRKLVEGSYIEIFFGHSPTLLEDRSTLTLMLNDIPLGSQFLDKSNLENTSWKVEIGQMDLGPGFHKFSIVIRMEATDNMCVDQNNPSNWLTLHKESVIHLRLLQRYEQADLSWYPSPFMEKGSIEPFQTAFIMPDEPSESEWMALAKLSRFFSSLNTANLINYKVLTESELTVNDNLLDSRNMIWIGSKNSWHTTGLELWEEVLREVDVNSLDDGDGMVHVRSSLWNEEKEMLLVTGDEQGLQNAVMHLTDQTLYHQFLGQTAVVTETKSTEALDSDQLTNGESIVTLASLDYNDFVIESPLVGTVRISYNVPTEWDISRGGKIRIHFHHSKSLNFAQSLAMIKINNIPVASTFLSEASSEFGVLEAEIPASALSEQQLFADVSFQFSSSGEACTGNSQIGNWSVIHKDSYFSFNLRPNRDINLLNLPYPFVSSRDWNSTVFVLPMSPSSEELSLFAVLNGIYGGSPHTYDEVTIVRDAVVSEDVIEDWSEKHLIWIGLAQRWPQWLADSDIVPVTYANEEWREQNDYVKLTESLKKQSGIMQIFPSPFNPLRDMLVLSGQSSDDIVRLGEMLTDRIERAKISGHVVVLDSLQRIHDFKTSQYEADSPSWDSWLGLLQTSDKPIINRLWIVLIILAILTVFSLVVWFTRKRNTDYEE